MRLNATSDPPTRLTSLVKERQWSALLAALQAPTVHDTSGSSLVPVAAAVLSAANERAPVEVEAIIARLVDASWHPRTPCDLPPNAPLLSICIPTYRRAPLLFHTLLSVARELDTCPHGEVEVVVNDNGGDEPTRILVETFARRSPQIRYFKNVENIGDATFFETPKRAIGEYAWWLGDDDLLLPDALAHLLLRLQSRRFDYLMLNRSIASRDLRRTLVDRKDPIDEDLAFPDIRDICARFGFWRSLGFISISVFRRERLISVDPTPYLQIPKFNHTQSAVLLEAFHDRPCLFVARTLVCHREFNTLGYDFWPYCGTVPLIGCFEILASKGVVDFTFLERNIDQAVFGKPAYLLDVLLRCLMGLVLRGQDIPDCDWDRILRVLDQLRDGRTAVAARAIREVQRVPNLRVRLFRRALRTVDFVQRKQRSWAVASVVSSASMWEDLHPGLGASVTRFSEAVGRLPGLAELAVRRSASPEERWYRLWRWCSDAVIAATMPREARLTRGAPLPPSSTINPPIHEASSPRF